MLTHGWLRPGGGGAEPHWTLAPPVLRTDCQFSTGPGPGLAHQTDSSSSSGAELLKRSVAFVPLLRSNSTPSNDHVAPPSLRSGRSPADSPDNHRNPGFQIRG